MKKIIVLFMTIFMLFTLSACSKVETYDNGVPTYFLEPEGYVIAKVNYNNNNILVSKYSYGYISDEDYQLYIDGTLNGVLVVKHPYEEGKEVSVPIDNIASIEIGIYLDLRE